MAFELLWTDHADHAGSYKTRAQAEADLLAYATEHPEQAEEIAVIEVNDQGHRIGEFVSGAELLVQRGAAA